MNYKDLIKIVLSIILFILSFIFKDFSFIFILIAYLIISLEIIIQVIKNLIKGELFDEEFLMVIATVGAFLIKEYTEGFLVMLLYQIGELLNDKAVDSSKDEIIKLMNLRSDKATLLKDDKEIVVDPIKVKVGDIILVKPGEKIPLDGIVIEGSSSLDTSSITGESVPRTVNKKDKVISGVININGVLRIEVTEIYKNSTVNKIINLIENSDEKKSDTEKFIDRFAYYYTPTVVFLALAIFIIPSIITSDYSTWLYRALVFLVTSCPCALVISIPLAYFIGIGTASKNGVLIKNSIVLDNLLNVSEIAFDKTGTITQGVFEVVDIKPNGITSKELLEITAKCESLSNHPIANSIRKKYNKQVDSSNIKNYKEVNGGIKLSIDKDKYIVGNYNLLKDNKIKFNRCLEIGTIVYVARNNEYLGYILIKDRIKNNVKKTIAELKKTTTEELVILSGDNDEIVNDVCKKVGIKRYMAELLPQDKVKYLKQAKKEHTNTMFVGDGVNDAPSLLISKIGVSMGGIGSDASIEASDMVIMNDDLTKINDAFKISKKTKKIILENICFVLFIKILVLITAALGYSNMLLAVLADVGVTLFTIINTFRILKYK